MSAEAEFHKGIQKYEAVVVGNSKALMNQLRTALKSLGFRKVSPFQSYQEALPAIQMGCTTHVLFDLEPNDLPPVSFVETVCRANKAAVLVAVSGNPALDNVFELIRAGARGFIVPPPTMQAIEAVFIDATKGPPISDAILKAEDKNHAFAELILNILYRAAQAMRQSRDGGVDDTFVWRCNNALRQTCDMARLFCQVEPLREKIIELCIKRADDKKTRLSALRKELKAQRV